MNWGVVPSTSDVTVKLNVLLLSDLVLVLGPERLNGVDLLAIEVNGVVDKVGILLDDGLNNSFLGVLLALVPELDHDLGSNSNVLSLGNLIRP